jgi:hypothetical protein
MTSDCSNLLDLKALLEKSARGLMAQVVEGYIRELGPLSCAIEGLSNRVRRKTEHLPVYSNRQRFEDGKRPAAERDGPGLISLCTRDVQRVATDMFPAHVSDLPPAASSEDGKTNDVLQEEASRMLAEKVDLRIAHTAFTLFARSDRFGKRENVPGRMHDVSLQRYLPEGDGAGQHAR